MLLVYQQLFLAVTKRHPKLKSPRHLSVRNIPAVKKRKSSTNVLPKTGTNLKVWRSSHFLWDFVLYRFVEESFTHNYGIGSTRRWRLLNWARCKIRRGLWVWWLLNWVRFKIGRGLWVWLLLNWARLKIGRGLWVWPYYRRFRVASWLRLRTDGRRDWHWIEHCRSSTWTIPLAVTDPITEFLCRSCFFFILIRIIIEANLKSRGKRVLTAVFMLSSVLSVKMRYGSCKIVTR